MAELSDLAKLRAKADAARDAATRAAGALEQSLDILKQEFGCVSIEQANAKLRALDKEITEKQKAYDEAVGAFESKWEKRL